MTETEKKINILFKELVPNVGKSDTVAGEIIRATSRIYYRNYNDGDHIGIGYGKETCNPAARYLIKNTGNEVANIIHDIWGVESNLFYEYGLMLLTEAVLEYIELHPELKYAVNNEDMLSFRDKSDFDFDEDE